MKIDWFQCAECGCIEKRALGFYRGHEIKLCTACGPSKNWHGIFERVYYPGGLAVPDDNGLPTILKPSSGPIFKTPERKEEKKLAAQSIVRCEQCQKKGYFPTGKCRDCDKVVCKQCGVSYSPTALRNNRKLCGKCEDDLPKNHLKLQWSNPFDRKF